MAFSILYLVVAVLVLRCEASSVFVQKLGAIGILFTSFLYWELLCGHWWSASLLRRLFILPCLDRPDSQAHSPLDARSGIARAEQCSFSGPHE